jgi:hypothetical protein
MTVEQRATQSAIIDKIDGQTDAIRSEMMMQHMETRERSAKNADDIQARIVAETSLLRDSVALVKGQALIIDERLEGMEEGSQETRTLLQKVLDVSSKLDRRFQKVEQIATQNKQDQTQIVRSLDDAFDVLAEYNQRKTNADLVSLTHHRRLNNAISLTGIRFCNRRVIHIAALIW